MGAWRWGPSPPWPSISALRPRPRTPPASPSSGCPPHRSLLHALFAFGIRIQEPATKLGAIWPQIKSKRSWGSLSDTLLVVRGATTPFLCFFSLPGGAHRSPSAPSALNCQSAPPPCPPGAAWEGAIVAIVHMPWRSCSDPRWSCSDICGWTPPRCAL